MQFDELFDKWYADRAHEVRQSTIATYRLSWKCLSPIVGHHDVSRFGKAEASLLLAALLGQGLSPKTARDRMALVRQLLVYASQSLEISIRPLDWRLKYPEGKPRIIKSFTEAEMLRIVRGVCEEINDGRYTTLPVLISILTGMRIGEVVGLRWGDIDYTHNVIHVERTVSKAYDPADQTERYFVGPPKSRAGYREVPLLPVLRRCLREVGRKSPQTSSYVVGDSPRHAHIRCVRESYARFLKRHKLPCINFHGLRHTYATLLVASGGDIKTISTLLGHSDVALTLNLYVHPSLESKRKVANRAFRKLRQLTADKDIM